MASLHSFSVRLALQEESIVSVPTTPNFQSLSLYMEVLLVSDNESTTRKRKIHAGRNTLENSSNFYTSAGSHSIRWPQKKQANVEENKRYSGY